MGIEALLDDQKQGYIELISSPKTRRKKPERSDDSYNLENISGTYCDLKSNDEGLSEVASNWVAANF